MGGAQPPTSYLYTENYGILQRHTHTNTPYIYTRYKNQRLNTQVETFTRKDWMYMLELALRELSAWSVGLLGLFFLPFISFCLWSVVPIESACFKSNLDVFKNQRVVWIEYFIYFVNRTINSRYTFIIIILYKHTHTIIVYIKI